MSGEISPSVRPLLEKLCQQLGRLGYSEGSSNCTVLYAHRLSDFMGTHKMDTYNAAVGTSFVEFCCKQEGSEKTPAKLFVERMNAVMNGTEFVVRCKRSLPATLPPDLEAMLSDYLRHGAASGFHSGTLLLYEKVCRWFLHYMAENGVTNKSEITSASVSNACLRVKSNCYFPVIRTLLHYLFDAGELDRDFSQIVPHYKIPQPMPSVYSLEEIQKLEAAVRANSSCGKRDYAMVLLATRLGLRAGDITSLTFDALDFGHDIIRLVQQKNEEPIELPMLPVIKTALLDYIKTSRRKSDSEFVFLGLTPPYTHVSVQCLGKSVRCALYDANIEPNGRRQGPHAMRSSLASSMVNDDVPYEVVRRVLGHTDANAIKNYARLDEIQLAKYTLEPPAASGRFAQFLNGEAVEK